MKKLLILVAALLSTLGLTAANADDYPSHPITLVAPFPPGGPTDTTARIMAEHMRKTLGQTIVIENTTGAGGTIGMARVAHATPDGYTILVGQWTTSVGGGALYKLNFSVIDDFEPISLLVSSPLWLVGRPNLPPNNAKELIAYLKANPHKVTAATIGAGSAGHMCLVYFANTTGTTMNYVPYRGGAPAQQDLMAGQVDLSCLEVSQTLGSYRAKRLKFYGVLAHQRWFMAPDVPTLEEAGVPGLTFPFWHGLWAPKGTPKPIIAKLNDAVVKAFADPGVQKHFHDLGMEIPPLDHQNPKALHDFHKAEIDKWWPIIKAAGIKMN
jgi:tripartite-type tricarboxylate transporter receptor subunit TctC